MDETRVRSAQKVNLQSLPKNDQQNGITEDDLYSRQRGVLGNESMQKMFQTKVLICGMGGLGCEIAKNVVLIGMRNVTIHDETNVTYNDLGTQCFLTEKDVGKNRAECTAAHLSELNTFCTITVNSRKLTESFMMNFDVVIMSNPNDKSYIKIAELCHSNKVKFILAESRGVFGKIFCDFGIKFTVTDVDGRQQSSSKIKSISNDGTVEVFEDDPHEFQDGDYVLFENVSGMTGLNEKEFKINKINPWKFSIGDATTYGDSGHDGSATLIKKPKDLDFRSYNNAFQMPKYIASDFTKMSDTETIHIAFETYYEFLEKRGSQPKPWNKEDAESFIEEAKQFNSKLLKPFKNVKDSLLRLFSNVSVGELCPVDSFIGGIVGQEIMKSCTGKFMPINQFFYFDCRECLPQNTDMLTQVGTTNIKNSSNKRYLSQIIVFGEEFQEKLNNLNCFLVGAGALGCEYLKNYAMMGVGAGSKGKVTVTDMDSISVSNLSRQFLFRPNDVGKSKTEMAGQRVKKMNPSMNLEAQSNCVDKNTEHIYDDNFFESLDLVCNALDNHEARLFVDGKCVFYGKPLIESGTNGCQGSTQSIVPYLSESYSSRPVPPTRTFAACTIKQSPYLIEHTIQWARDIFEGTFKNSAEICQSYYEDPEKYKITKMQQEKGIFEVEQLYETLLSVPENYADCVKWAMNLWGDYFHHGILQLLKLFPPDCTTDQGTLYWSGAKKCPHALDFDSNDERHLRFIYSAANIRAEMFDIKHNKDINEVKRLLNEIDSKNETLKEKISDSSVLDSQSDEEKLEELFKKLENIDSSKLKLGKKIKPIEFEKDDDTNFHIDFIESCANLRAINYCIPTADRYKIKVTAGRIIAALVTTTSAIVGLCCLELYKLLQNHKELMYYKNSMINLAQSFFAIGPVIPSPKISYLGKQYTIWDRIHIEKNKTLREVLKYFVDTYSLNVMSIVCKDMFLYIGEDENLDLMLYDIISKKIYDDNEVPQYMNSIELHFTVEDLSEKPQTIPKIKYLLK